MLGAIRGASGGIRAVLGLAGSVGTPQKGYR